MNNLMLRDCLFRDLLKTVDTYRADLTNAELADALIDVKGEIEAQALKDVMPAGGVWG